MKLSLSLMLLTCSLVSCRPVSTISEVDEQLSVSHGLSAFGKIAADMDEEARMRMCSIEELYFYAQGHDDPLLAKLADFGSSWHFYDRSNSKKYSYLVYPNTNGINPKDAVFIAAPRLTQMRNKSQRRLVLLHSLEVVPLDDSDFHARIIRQLQANRSSQ